MYRLSPQQHLTSLLGRERDVNAISALLLRGEVRIVTLTGPGGVGKTRLALHVAGQLQDEYPDQVVTVDLASTTSSELVLPAIARAFGITEAGADSIMARLVRAVGDRQLLLLIDNFEQVVSAATTVSHLMNECPGITFLITSRMPLHLVGEREYAVSSLETPPLDAAKRGGRGIGDYPAVELFIERARAAHRAFAPSDEMMEIVARITTLLDGLPLAIELAAARTKLFSLPALEGRLDDRLGLLTGGPRDQPDRLQTMRNAIAWSYDLLSEGERAVFRRVSVFSGSFSLEAAEAVVGQAVTADELEFVVPRDGPPTLPEALPNVLDHLESLVDKSILQVMTGMEDDVRFRMMLTIQEFGRDALAQANGVTLMRIRMLRFLHRYLHDVEERLVGPEQRIWLGRLDLELGNLRQALQLAIDHPAEFGEIGVELASSVWRYWLTRGQVVEGARWLEQALACRRDVELPAMQEAEALNHLGNLRLELGDHGAAAEQYQESLDIYRSVGYRDGIATELNNLGLLYIFQGKTDAARAALEESLAMRRDGGDQLAMPNTLSNLGDLAVDEGKYDIAETYFSEALNRRRDIGNLRGMAFSCYSLGMVALYRDEYDRAQAWFDEGLEYQAQLDDVYSLALMMLGLGQLNLANGTISLSMKQLRRALETFHKMGSRRMMTVVIDAIAVAAERHGFDREAARLMGATHAVRTEQGGSQSARDLRETTRLTASLTRRLGAPAFQREYTVGQRQWLNHAVVEALALTREIGGRGKTTGPEHAGVPAGRFDPAVASRRAKELGLTRREREVLALLVRGASDKEIADELSIAPRTAMTHVSNILSKLGVNRRTAAASLALREGLIDPDAVPGTQGEV